MSNFDFRIAEPHVALWGFTKHSVSHKNKSLGGLLFCLTEIIGEGDSVFLCIREVQQLPHQVITLYYKWNKNDAVQDPSYKRKQKNK